MAALSRIRPSDATPYGAHTYPWVVCPRCSIFHMRKDPYTYYQEVLDKISFADAAVFRKELRKAMRRLMPEEREQLRQWFRSHCVCKSARPAGPGIMESRVS